MVVSNEPSVGEVVLKPRNLVTSFGPRCGVLEPESDGQPVLGWLVVIWVVYLRDRNTSLTASWYIG
jgi:hypothetical protein